MVVKLLLASGSAANQTGSMGRTVMHDLCDQHRTNSPNDLLKLPIFNADARDYFGSTPLHIAVRAQHTPCVQSLITAGVNLDIADNSGATPVEIALGNKNPDILNLLAVSPRVSWTICCSRLVQWTHRRSLF